MKRVLKLTRSAYDVVNIAIVSTSDRTETDTALIDIRCEICVAYDSIEEQKEAETVIQSVFEKVQLDIKTLRCNFELLYIYIYFFFFEIL